MIGVVLLFIADIVGLVVAILNQILVSVVMVLVLHLQSQNLHMTLLEHANLCPLGLSYNFPARVQLLLGDNEFMPLSLYLLYAHLVLDVVDRVLHNLLHFLKLLEFRVAFGNLVLDFHFDVGLVYDL